MYRQSVFLRQCVVGLIVFKNLLIVILVLVFTEFEDEYLRRFLTLGIVLFSFMIQVAMTYWSFSTDNMYLMKCLIASMTLIDLLSGLGMMF
jgi:hypothetical protein